MFGWRSHFPPWLLRDGDTLTVTVYQSLVQIGTLIEACDELESLGSIDWFSAS